MTEYEIKRLEDRIRELWNEKEGLQKENAELKEQVNILDNCDRLGDTITEAYKEQLTKAKEIISKLLIRLHERTCTGLDCEDCKQAQQFLKENGGKK